MKKLYTYLAIGILIGALITPANLMAGNKDRSGQAGAPELLINPWARSSGWGSANTSCIHGLEAMFLNVAGIAFTHKTELIFSRTDWLKGSGININTFGLAQRLGETSVIALAVMSMSFGDIDITTEDLPEGGIGTFSPNMMNFNLSYAKAFSNSIYGGANIKIISESISDNSAQGIAIDAGIQYVTGKKENIHFGVSMKNIGTRLKFTGDGLSLRHLIPGTANYITAMQRSAEFELPSLINIGAAYDFHFSDIHSLTAAGNFTSNSFTKDLFSFGLEYGFKSYLHLRAGYTYEDGSLDENERTNVFTGPSAGFSVDIPLNKEKGTIFSLDYSYRATNPFDGTHSIGVKVSI
jgi:hypothetical protein